MSKLWWRRKGSMGSVGTGYTSSRRKSSIGSMGLLSIEDDMKFRGRRKGSSGSVGHVTLDEDFDLKYRYGY